jgi:hypothetical protein
MSREVPKGDGPAAARFNQLEVIRFSSEVKSALGHSASRNEKVAQVLCFFSLIRSTTPTLDASRVLIEKAQYNMFSSPDGYQAAHYLPCQLRIVERAAEARLPWDYVPKPTARQALQNLFAEVEHLPVAFNKADSAAEEKGLKEAFRTVGEIVLRDPMILKRGSANKMLIRRSYDIWKAGANNSYNAAIVQKMSVSEVPSLEFDEQGNITNLLERSSANWNREHEIGILQRYSETLRSLPSSLSDEKIAELERSFA